MSSQPYIGSILRASAANSDPDCLRAAANSARAVGVAPSPVVARNRASFSAVRTASSIWPAENSNLPASASMSRAGTEVPWARRAAVQSSRRRPTSGSANGTTMTPSGSRPLGTHGLVPARMVTPGCSARCRSNVARTRPPSSSPNDSNSSKNSRAPCKSDSRKMTASSSSSVWSRGSSPARTDSNGTPSCAAIDSPATRLPVPCGPWK